MDLGVWGITEIGNFGGPTKRERKYPVGMGMF